MDEPLDRVGRRNWQRIAAGYFPGAVVVDRSAFDAMPSKDGSLFLDVGPERTRREAVKLPGLTLRPRPGPGPVEGDMPFMDGLYFSGPARKFLDNMRPSRPRNGDASRTLSRTEVEKELARLVSFRGKAGLNELRDDARRIAAALGAEAEMKGLEDLIGAVLGTREATLASAVARAHGRGEGFDPRRSELFEILQSYLLEISPLAHRPQQHDEGKALPFIEAYFSNYIEGTEFKLGEAEDIVFKKIVPPKRLEDAYDVLGTYELVVNPTKRAQVPRDAPDLIGMLRSHHAVMLERRTYVGPGEFKEMANQAGGTSFVHPDLVVGTLVEGYRFYEALPPGLARAIFMMFLVAEVHPFTDGNGRVARVLMNAELTAAGLQRIVIPLPYRNEYLQGLRALSRGARPNALVRVLDYAQEYATEIIWSDLRVAEARLSSTNAFVPQEEAEMLGVRLKLPSSARD
ncbi:MAG TPA: Fic family protein [Solirubrobacterales bacterium]|nr:Fic family protein [Solirubrobacterales bacterium]